MKAIEFRAWDERNKVMHNDFQFFGSGTDANDWICFQSDKEKPDARGIGITFNNPYLIQQLKIMQFTGLLDKNGKEIFEGDMLKLIMDTSYDTGTIPSFIEDHREVVVPIEWVQEKMGYVPECLEDYVSIEVIGNIYENPELVKQLEEE